MPTQKPRYTVIVDEEMLKKIVVSIFLIQTLMIVLSNFEGKSREMVKI